MNQSADLPPGATPLDEDESEGLIPSHVSTRRELNAWEQVNIAKAVTWLRRRVPDTSLLTASMVREVHRRMFSDTWTWAGTFRKTLKSIGVPPGQITSGVHDLLKDVTYWIEHRTYLPDENACRFHHRLVSIHPFPNGNGRHARIMADELLRYMDADMFTWGSGSIDSIGSVRADYINALRAADVGNYAKLLKFVRS